MTDDAPGWDAIDARLAEFYPSVESQPEALTPGERAVPGTPLIVEVAA